MDRHIFAANLEHLVCRNAAKHRRIAGELGAREQRRETHLNNNNNNNAPRAKFLTQQCT